MFGARGGAGGGEGGGEKGEAAFYLYVSLSLSLFFLSLSLGSLTGSVVSDTRTEPYHNRL